MADEIHAPEKYTSVCKQCGSPDVMPMYITANSENRYACENCENKMFSPDRKQRKNLGEVYKEKCRKLPHERGDTNHNE